MIPENGEGNHTCRLEMDLSDIKEYPVFSKKAFILFDLLLMAIHCERSQAQALAEPVPEILQCPERSSSFHSVPVIKSQRGLESEKITIRNDFMSLDVEIDSDRRVAITSFQTKNGRELLGAPAIPFSLVKSDGTVIESGGKGFPAAWVGKIEEINVTESSGQGQGLIENGQDFKVASWHPWQRFSYAEIEFQLEAPEPLIWRVRLYRDRSYLEQRFEVPADWRDDGKTVAQNLRLDASLRPVMPTNVFSGGFSEGRPNVTGRHRFEFVAQSDHVGYDATRRVGVAAFVAGIGGEEWVAPESLMLLDHATETFGSEEPPARFLIWPFEGPVQKGFMGIKQFIADEYSCQGDKFGPFAWNQFWLWQGGPQPAGVEVVTAARLLDILPRIADLGCEEFHLDMGWEAGGGNWRFAPERFPEGFAPLRAFLHERGMRYHTWMNGESTDDAALVEGLIEQTDLCKLFMDRMVTERSVASMRKVRQRYSGFETFAHHTSSRSQYYPWGNIHFLSDFNQVYFGEGQFWLWSNVLPGDQDEPDPNKRFFSTHSLRAGDLVTRSAAYQAHWVWPYKCIVPPHNGWAWFEDRPLDELASRMFTTIAARYDYQWGFDPAIVRQEALDFFLDWTAFFKVARPYLQRYQHVLPLPDGIHPDGAAHLKDGKGFIVLCNPAKTSAQVEWKEILWEPELALDPEAVLTVSDWTQPLDPKDFGTVSGANPAGVLKLEPLSYRVIGFDIDIQSFLASLKQERAEVHGPKD